MREAQIMAKPNHDAQRLFIQRNDVMTDNQLVIRSKSFACEERTLGIRQKTPIPVKLQIEICGDDER